MHCVVKDCQSIKSVNEDNSQIILHSFPKDEILRNKWLLILGIREGDFCKNSKVCSLHFSENHYKSSQSLGGKYLEDFAFPTQKLNINFNNNLYAIKNRDDVIIPTSGVEFQNDKVQLNLDEKPQKHFSLHRKPLQSKPQILSIFPISNSSNEVQYISEIMPEVSISNNFLQNIQEKPKILSVVEISISNDFKVKSPKETNYANNYPLAANPPEEDFTEVIKPVKRTSFVKRTSPVKRNRLQEAPEEDKPILNKTVLSDSEAKELILKNKDVRNVLKEREQTIHALKARMNRNIKRIMHMERTLAEERLLQLHGY